jgi:hypothetical protein
MMPWRLLFVGELLLVVGLIVYTIIYRIIPLLYWLCSAVGCWNSWIINIIPNRKP